MKNTIITRKIAESINDCKEYLKENYIDKHPGDTFINPKEKYKEVERDVFVLLNELHGWSGDDYDLLQDLYYGWSNECKEYTELLNKWISKDNFEPKNGFEFDYYVKKFFKTRNTKEIFEEMNRLNDNIEIGFYTESQLEDDYYDDDDYDDDGEEENDVCNDHGYDNDGDDDNNDDSHDYEYQFSTAAKYNEEEREDGEFYYQEEDDRLYWEVDRRSLGIIVISNRKLNKFLEVCKDEKEIDLLIENYNFACFKYFGAVAPLLLRPISKEENLITNTVQLDNSILVLAESFEGDVWYSSDSRNLHYLAALLVAWTFLEISDKVIDNRIYGN